MLEKLKELYHKTNPKKQRKPQQTLPYVTKKDTAISQENNTKGTLSQEFVKHTETDTTTHIANPYLQILYTQENTPIIDVSTDTNPTIGFQRIHALNSFDLGKIHEK